jgi:hypothetical protein
MAATKNCWTCMGNHCSYIVLKTWKHLLEILCKKKHGWPWPFSDFLRVLDASKGRNNLFFVDNCAGPAKYIISKDYKSCVLSIKLHKCVTTSWIGHHKMFQAVLQEASTTKSCLLDGLRTGHQTENQCFASDTFAVTAWWQVEQLTFMNCFHQCSYGHKLNTEAD